MSLQRLLTNVLSDDLKASRNFYVSLFNLKVTFDSDWFVHLSSNVLEIGIIEKNHDIVPEQARGMSSGHYLTFVVVDLEKVKKTAESSGFEIIQQPQPTSYGQLRMIVKAPEGTICDISMPT